MRKLWNAVLLYIAARCVFSVVQYNWKINGYDESRYDLDNITPPDLSWDRVQHEVVLLPWSLINVTKFRGEQEQLAAERFGRFYDPAGVLTSTTVAAQAEKSRIRSEAAGQMPLTIKKQWVAMEHQRKDLARRLRQS